MSKKPKLVVSVTDPTGAMYFRGQLAYMQRRGFEVILISGPGAYPQQVVHSQGARHYALAMSRDIDVVSDVVGLVRLWRFMRRERPTIVNGTTPKAGFLVIVAAWLAGVPVRVYTLRGLRSDTLTGVRRSILTLTERITCALAHRVICISPSLRAKAISLGLVAPEKAVVLGPGSSNGVDLEMFSPTEARKEVGREIRRRLGIQADEVVVGFVGRLVRDKGIRELLRAWPVLRARYPIARLVLVGPLEVGDAIEPEYREQIHRDPTISHVDFVSDTSAYYCAMDIVVLPSYREGFGNVLIEAGAMQRPVIATRIDGCVDAVVEGCTGVLVPPRDVDALISAIGRYLEDSDLRRAHGENGRQRAVSEFACERVWELIAREFDRLSSRHKPLEARTRMSPVSITRWKV